MTNNRNELINNLIANNFEIYTIEQEKEYFLDADIEIIEAMERLNCGVLLHNSVMARNWYFSNMDALINHFNNGGLVGYDDANTRIA